MLSIKSEEILIVTKIPSLNNDKLNLNIIHKYRLYVSTWKVFVMNRGIVQHPPQFEESKLHIHLPASGSYQLGRRTSLCVQQRVP